MRAEISRPPSLREVRQRGASVLRCEAFIRTLAGEGGRWKLAQGRIDTLWGRGPSLDRERPRMASLPSFGGFQIFLPGDFALLGQRKPSSRNVFKSQPVVIFQSKKFSRSMSTMTNELFSAVRKRNISLVIGSSLNAG
jgi:hypothetical protein